MAENLSSILETVEFGEESRFDTIVERIASLLGQRASAKSVFGDPVERDGVTIIPVAKVRWGFGGGSGAGTGGKNGEMEAGEGGGGGGGVGATPLGYIEIRDGVATFKRINEPMAIGATVLAGAIGFWIVVRALRGLVH